MRLRIAFSVVGLAAVLICVALLLFFRTKPPLTVVPTGQPRFQVTEAGILGASQVDFVYRSSAQ
jgi:hypothetical protein